MKKYYKTTVSISCILTLYIIPCKTEAKAGLEEKSPAGNFTLLSVPDTIVLDSASGGYFSWPGRRMLSFNQSRNMPPGDQLFIQYRLDDPFCWNTPWQKFNSNIYKTNWYNDTVSLAWTNSSGSVHSSVEFYSSGCTHTFIYFRIVYISNTGNQTAYASVSNFVYGPAPTHLELIDTTYTGNLCGQLNVNFNISGHCPSCDGSSTTDMKYDIDFGDGQDTLIIKVVPNPGNFYYSISHTYASPGTYIPVFHVWNFGGGGYSSMSITINNSPSALVTAGGPATFCTGGNVMLNAPLHPNLAYQWKKGVSDIPGATSSNYIASTGGVYKVSVTNTITGCSKTTGPGTIVTVNPLPNAAITPQGPTTFCAGNSVVLKANSGPGLTYKWKKDGTFINGAIGLNYTAFVAGTYKVQVTNSNSCKKTSGGVLVSVPCREEEANETGSGISLFPNPASGKFTIQSLVENISQITITNLSGQVITRKDFLSSPLEASSADYEIDLTGHSKGIYLVRVITDKKVYNRKIILN